MNSGQTSKIGYSSLTSLGPVVVMIVVLFAAMVIAGITLNHQINVIEANGQGLDWAQDFSQTNRVLLIVLAVSSFALVSLLTFLLWNLRRFTDGSQESASELLRERDTLQMRSKQLEGDLANERAQLKSLLNNMQESVIFSENEYVRYTNQAFTRLSGYSADELSGKKLIPDHEDSRLETELGRLHKAVSGAVALGGTWKGPYTLHSRNGEELDVAVTGTSVRSPSNGHGSQIMTLIRDTSQEKRLQEQKASFVSNTSHELRTPLSNLKMRVYLLRKQPDKIEEHLQVMENVTAYMQQLLDEMFDMGRFETGVVILERENGVLQELVEEAVKGFKPRAARRTVTLNLDMPTDPITIMVDHKRIVQVITNLVANAMNHTPQNGLIEVSVAVDETPRGGSFARIEVCDNGVGIQPDVLAQVFQPFATASQGVVSGTVLGLSLAKEIIELHGGTISVDSEVGHGAVYTICLPILETH